MVGKTNSLPTLKIIVLRSLTTQIQSQTIYIVRTAEQQDIEIAAMS